MKNDNTAFLGVGWSFPPEFSESGRNLVTVSGEEDVRQSLQILLGTRLNERILQEEYGSSLHDFVFEEAGADFLNQVRSMLAEAILYHEPRVDINGIQLEQDETEAGLLYIVLDYSIPASNTRFNMVYPFYIREASV